MKLFVDRETADFIINDRSIGDIITVELMEKAVLEVKTLGSGVKIPTTTFKVLITESCDIQQYEAYLSTSSRMVGPLLLRELEIGKPATLAVAKYATARHAWNSFTVNGRDPYAGTRVR